MSQANWDTLIENKQDIIDGKFIWIAWNEEILKSINPALTEKEIIKVFKLFDEDDDNGVGDMACDRLEQIADDVVANREEVTV